jgi:hypothetical protein
MYVSLEEISSSFKVFDVSKTKTDKFIIFIFQSEPIVMAVFSLGFIFFTITIINFLKFKKNLNTKTQHPTAPWKWDFNWNPTGHIISFKKKLFVNFFVLIAAVTTFAIVKYYYETQTNIPLRELLFILGIIITVLGFVSYNILKALKFSKVSCLYKYFPFKITQKVKVEILGLPLVKTPYEVKLEIRFLEVQMIKTGGAGKKRTKIRYMELHKITSMSRSHSINNGKLYIEIPTPERTDYTTDLTKNRPRYWELRVTAAVPGLDNDFGFLIPIY